MEIFIGVSLMPGELRDLLRQRGRISDTVSVRAGCWSHGMRHRQRTTIYWGLGACFRRQGLVEPN